jgi:hypothetical protein
MKPIFSLAVLRCDGLLVSPSQGHISHVDDAIIDYFEGLKDSVYDGVALKHILQMSPGARCNEDCSDPLSDIDNSSKEKIHDCFWQKTMRGTDIRASS